MWDERFVHEEFGGVVRIGVHKEGRINSIFGRRVMSGLLSSLVNA